ncbi:MAG: ABC transporter substrate-binding protein [Mesorhizobium amorphae]|nr:MAG: ABC transporter substrate-binding protein [Mesorhizobium amorphae]
MKGWMRVWGAAGLLLAASLSAHAARTDLVLGVTLEPPHLDPTAGAAAAIDEIVYGNVFQGLTAIGSRGEVLPALAESWDVSADGKTYTFKLRSGVRFHDGSGFDAQDVKFSLDRARAADSVNAQKGLFAAIATVEAVDPLTVKITLSTPQGAFPYNLGWGDAVIVAPETAATNRERPVGTGPYRFERWARGSSLTLVRADTYWGTPAALERAEFRFVPDAAAAVPALLSGDVQAFPFFPPDSASQIEGDPRFTVEVGSTEGETILAINNARPPFDDIRVRQAIAHAIDRQALIDGASAGFGVPIGSHFAPHNPAYVDLTGTYPHDVEKARALLREAGHERIQATLKLPPTPYARLGGEIIASELREIGIELESVPVEWADWLSGVFTNRDYDLTIVSHTEPNDIDIYARKDYYFGYSNPAFDAVIAKLNATSDETERTSLLREAQTILAKDAVVGFLFELPKVGVWDAKLEGFWQNAPIQATDLSAVRWKE